MNYSIPYLCTGNLSLDKAFRVAYSDILSNVALCSSYDSQLKCNHKPVILAGQLYSTPWTRDAAINVWNGAGVLFPEASKNSLEFVLEDRNGWIAIAGEYWDAIIWVIGAWNYYIYTGDKEFLKKAYDITYNNLEYFLKTEFDENKNLFRGPACYGDGVSAYPDIYAQHGYSGIASFVDICKDKCVDKGIGNPMFTLSTNALYYQAYKIAAMMQQELSVGDGTKMFALAEKVKEAINKYFWDEEKGYFRYIVDDFGGSDAQEGMGQSFVILFGLANDKQKERIFKNQYISKQGITCLWPNFKRYDKLGQYGRHCGTVWPQIEAFWADAAAQNNRYDLFDNEFTLMTNRALRDGFFGEVYHPVTGELYGGVQELYGQGIVRWEAGRKQTWCATGYINLVLKHILGFTFEKDGLYFKKPHVPQDVKHIEFKNFKYRNMCIECTIDGNGEVLKSIKINGINGDFLSAKLNGEYKIEIKMGGD